MTPEEAKVKQVQDDAMSGMKAKFSMLNGNRLDETLRTGCYSSIKLLFDKATLRQGYSSHKGATLR